MVLASIVSFIFPVFFAFFIFFVMPSRIVVITIRHSPTILNVGLHILDGRVVYTWSPSNLFLCHRQTLNTPVSGGHCRDRGQALWNFQAFSWSASHETGGNQKIGECEEEH